MPQTERTFIDPNYGLKVALLILLIFFAYLCGVTFLTVTEDGNEHAKTIVPYLLSIITLLIGFYWGSSHEKGKGAQLTSITPVDVAAVEAAKVVATDAVADAVEEVKDKK